jgi:hypothetical protein
MINNIDKILDTYMSSGFKAGELIIMKGRQTGKSMMNFREMQRIYERQLIQYTIRKRIETVGDILS